MAQDPARRSTSKPTWADFCFDAFFTGAVGGSVVALFFLLVDAIEGRPMFTPSLMGSVLFQGAAASQVHHVQLDMVAAYTAVHFASFALLGVLIAFAVREVELHARNPFGVLLGLFVVFEWGFFVATLTLLPGVMKVLGPLRVALANLLAAAAIALVLVWQHSPESWRRVRSLIGMT